jgi:hypothetical protein
LKIKYFDKGGKFLTERDVDWYGFLHERRVSLFKGNVLINTLIDSQRFEDHDLLVTVRYQDYELFPDPSRIDSEATK